MVGELLHREHRAAEAQHAVAERRLERIGLGAPARHHGDDAAQDVADADGDHHHREGRIAEHRADHDPLDQHADRGHHDDGEQDRRPIRPAQDGARGQPEEGAEHHQVALREIDRLGRLVDQHEAERDERVHAALRDACKKQLQELAEHAPSPSVIPGAAQREPGIHNHDLTERTFVVIDSDNRFAVPE